MPPIDRGTSSDGALAPLLGRIQREKATGHLRLSAMEVRGGVPVVMRWVLRVAGGRVEGIEDERGGRASRAASDTARDLAQRATAVVADLLACHDGVYAWEPEAAASAGGGPCLAHIVRPALMTLPDAAAVRVALGPMERPLLATPAGAADVGALTEGQTVLLGRAAGGPTAADLCRHGFDTEAAERDLLVLIGMGLVSWASEQPRVPAQPVASGAQARPVPPSAPAPTVPPVAPPPAPRKETQDERRRDIEQAHAALRGANHFQVLGLSEGASAADVRQAFARMARRYHPDAHTDPALGDLRSKLVDLFVAVGKAHDVLKDAAARERYERALGLGARPPAPAAPRVSADRAADEPVETRILRAEEALSAGQPWEAIRLLEEAVPAAAGSLKPRARVLLGRAYAERDRPREAEKVLLAALQDDPRSVPACLALGRLYRDRGMVKRARGMLEKALEIDPRQAEARRELSLLGEDPPGPEGRGSLLSRLRDRR